VVAADLIAKARAGDCDAFRELTEPYLRELQVREPGRRSASDHGVAAPRGGPHKEDSICSGTVPSIRSLGGAQNGSF
jgi:hypothetical protein